VSDCRQGKNEAMSTEPAIVVSDNPERERYEIRVGDELAGFTQYRARPGLIAFIHTEVDDRFEGQGIGSRLAAGVMDFLRDHDLRIVPTCAFLRAYMARHVETHDLLAPGTRLPSA
jgi:predicted GNAT family acetyltransferase